MNSLHIVFGWSAYWMLRNILRQRGLPDRVTRLGDDLSWGPIAGTLAARIRYLDSFCPIPGGWSWIQREHRNFRKYVEGPLANRTIWLGSNNAAELCGYYRYLDSFGDLPADIIRPDDFLPPHPKYGPAGSVGILNLDQVAECLDHAPRSPIGAEGHLRERWSQLKSQDTLLRVVEHGEVRSVEVDYLDRLIVAATPPDWERSIRVVGNALGAAFDEGRAIHSDFLFGRLGALVDSGTIEADGKLFDWTQDGRRSDPGVRLRPV